MPIGVSTKDCTALSDAELVEMADLCADRPPGFDIGFLSKEREAWVLITQAREGNKLRGHLFCTLERIGGTPSLLVGLALVDRTSRAEAAPEGDHGGPVPPGAAGLSRRGRPARYVFLDVARRLSGVLGPQDVVPFPDHKSSGEERAWARRLSKRFGCESLLTTERSCQGRRLRRRRPVLLCRQGQDPEGVDSHFASFDADKATAWYVRLGHGRGPGRGKLGR